MKSAIVSIYCPTILADFVAQRSRMRNPNQLPAAELLFSVRERGNEYVARASAASLKAGISAGMLLAEAQTQSESPKILVFHAEQERRLLMRLCEWALRFSPAVALDVSSGVSNHTSLWAYMHVGINLDVSGCERLFNGYECLLKELVTALRSRGVHARCAVAPTLGAAWALSRFSKTHRCVLSKARLLPLIEELPLAALRLPHSLLMSLNEVQILRIGELRVLPRSAIQERYGALVVRRLAQACEGLSEVIPYCKPTEPLLETLQCETPLATQSAVAAALCQMNARLCVRLVERKQLLNSLKLRLKHPTFRSGSSPVWREVSISFVAPTANQRHIERVLLERVATVYGAPVNELQLEVSALQAEQPRQLSSEPSDMLAEEHERVYGELLDSLIARLGRQHVCRPEIKSSYLPEKSQCYQPLEQECVEQAADTAIAAARPSLMLPRPYRISVIALMPDHPPSWLLWKSGRCKVLRGSGPERIVPEWWQDEAQTMRDYFRVQLENGAWLWIFRDEDSAWYVHGLWV